MPLTSGGDSGKTVVYTDLELSRPLLEHYRLFQKDPWWTRGDSVNRLTFGRYRHFEHSPRVYPRAILSTSDE